MARNKKSVKPGSKRKTNTRKPAKHRPAASQGLPGSETKGREDPDVAQKDRAARLWCENATQLTGQAWGYLKVPQAGFDRLQPGEYGELVVFEASGVTA